MEKNPTTQEVSMYVTRFKKLMEGITLNGNNVVLASDLSEANLGNISAFQVVLGVLLTSNNDPKGLTSLNECTKLVDAIADNCMGQKMGVELVPSGDEILNTISQKTYYGFGPRPTVLLSG